MRYTNNLPLCLIETYYELGIASLRSSEISESTTSRVHMVLSEAREIAVEQLVAQLEKEWGLFLDGSFPDLISLYQIQLQELNQKSPAIHKGMFFFLERQTITRLEYFIAILELQSCLNEVKEEMEALSSDR